MKKRRVDFISTIFNTYFVIANKNLGILLNFKIVVVTVEPVPPLPLL
jgi:hypothetical protein